jgi:hypothetical protein
MPARARMAPRVDVMNLGIISLSKVNRGLKGDVAIIFSKTGSESNCFSKKGTDLFYD